MDRTEHWERLRQQSTIDVLVIGGGVNGIGTFRDLALQGLNVVLVERDDFCSGASAASSHMLHGGIRYLENGEFRLVREALTERNLMLRNAPHYAKPLPTTIPIFRWFSGFFNAPLKFLGLRDKPGERGAVIIKLGLIMYDIFARNYRVMPTHQFDLKGASLRRYPKLNPDIVCTATYYDAWMPYPERICVELVLEGEAAGENVQALNYVSAVGGAGDTVTLRDELTGETLDVQPRVVVNAAGPWIDFANRNLGHETRFIGGTKGSHLILDNPELHTACDGHEMFFENADGRILLVLPFHDKVMVGTTDIRIDNPDEAVTTDEEIDYILGSINHVFPEISVDRAQIVFHFSGVRPLPSSDAAFTGSVSRDHSIQTIEPDAQVRYPVLSLIGGKWTTYRAFAEETANIVMARLAWARQQSTARLPIGGGRDYPQDEAVWVRDWSGRVNLPIDRVETLFRRYGTRAGEIAAFCAAAPDTVLQHHPGYTRREITFLAQREKVARLDDLVLRRTLIAWLGELNDALLVELAEVLQAALGWSDEQTRTEVERAAGILRDQHGVRLQNVSLGEVETRS